MHLQQLLDNANQSTEQKIRCQGRNVELDFAELASRHPDAATCGDQLPQGALQCLRNAFKDPAKFDEPNDLLDRNFKDLHQDLTSSLENGQLTFSGVRQNAAPITLARYMDLDSIHRHWLDGNKTDSPETKKQKLREFQSRIDQLKNKQKIWQQDSELENILFGKPDTVVWAVPYDGTPPHQQPPYNTSAQKANALCRDLALPISSDKLSEKVGLVAILYELAQNQLIKPNIAYAEGYGVFFPGLKSESFGRTAPLSDQFALPWQRNHHAEGVAECVHPNQKLIDLHITSIEYVGDFV